MSRMAAAMLPATARWRNAHTVRVVRLSRRILSVSQTLMVRPQPERRWRLLQKMRRARMVGRVLLSSTSVCVPWRMSVPTVLQCGHGVSLSRSTMAAHSASPRQNQRTSLASLTIGPRLNAESSNARWAGEERGPMDSIGGKKRGRPTGPGRRIGPGGCQIAAVKPAAVSDDSSVRIQPKMRSDCGKGQLQIPYWSFCMGVSIHIDSNCKAEVIPLAGKNEIDNLWMPIIQRDGLHLIQQCVSGGLQVSGDLYD